MPENIIHKAVGSFSPAQMAFLARKTPLSVVKTLARTQFQWTIRYAAKHSPFYCRKFKELGINASKIRDPQDLGDFYTTAQDILDCEQEFICQNPAIAFESSGTSGTNKRIFFSRSELERISVNSAAGLLMMGVEKHDRAANAFDFSMWISGLLSHYGLMRAGVFTAPIGKSDPSEVYSRIERYGFNVILGLPSWIVRLTEIANSRRTHKLKLILVGGEGLGDQTRKWISQSWHGANVKLNYASSEMGGVMGFEPCDLGLGYHINVADFWPEIINTDLKGFGELVFTTLSRNTMPLIRFRTSDIARFEKDPCPCGFPWPLMSHIIGRLDEIVVAGGFNLYPVMLENILSKVPGVGLDFQAIFVTQANKDVCELKIETVRTDSDILKREILAQVQSQYPELMRNIDARMLDLAVIPSPPNTIRTGRKLKRLFDHRPR